MPWIDQQDSNMNTRRTWSCEKGYASDQQIIPLHEELVSNLSMILRSKTLSSTARTCGFASLFNPIVTADILRSSSQVKHPRNQNKRKSDRVGWIVMQRAKVLQSIYSQTRDIKLGKKSYKHRYFVIFLGVSDMILFLLDYEHIYIIVERGCWSSLFRYLILGDLFLSYYYEK